ncbi:hypothetical protein B0H14DRAFT_3428699 [Mycena olivaceomarginata]|nr:hypothetical protein B0H14DRAFT_3428699 [Mycena olivaceomarginata]
MSDHSLPDEIISEILSPALKVSDEAFCDTSDVSPFAKYSESTAAYLLVCKSWLRLATPLLYNVVVLWYKAYCAKALQSRLLLDTIKIDGQLGPPAYFPFPIPRGVAKTVLLPLKESQRLEVLVIPDAYGISWAYSMFKSCPGMSASMSADLCRPGSCIARADDPSERSDYDAFVTCRMSSPTVLYP